METLNFSWVVPDILANARASEMNGKLHEIVTKCVTKASQIVFSSVQKKQSTQYSHLRNYQLLELRTVLKELRFFHEQSFNCSQNCINKVKTAY
jgi:hypothetical protein